MGILLWIIQTFLWAAGKVLTKKMLEQRKIGDNWQTIFNKGWHIIIMIPFIFIWILSFDIPKQELTLFNILLFILWAILIASTYPFRRIAYANEKVSVLQPFEMLFQVFTIIIWFIFIATERANTITFMFAIIATLVVIAWSMQWKKVILNKYSAMIGLGSIIKSGQVFIMLYFIQILSPATFYTLESLIIIVASFALVIGRNQFAELWLLTKKYIWILLISNGVIICAILLSLGMYKNLWVVATSLISLSYLIFVYFFGYVLLKEIPKSKDIIVTFLVVICIIAGMMFKVTS